MGIREARFLFALSQTYRKKLSHGTLRLCKDTVIVDLGEALQCKRSSTLKTWWSLRIIGRFCRIIRLLWIAHNQCRYGADLAIAPVFSL